MAYERINWQNEPSEATALNNVNLNKMDNAIYELDRKATTTDTDIANLQNGKVDKVNGKGLSQVDSVSVIASTYAGTKIGEVNVSGVGGATQGTFLFNGVVVDNALSSSSENPVQNKVVTGALDNKVDKESGKGLSYYDVISVARETSKGSQIGSINLIYKDGNYESNPLYNGIEVDSAMSNTSENPVQNKVIYDALNNLLPSKTVSGNPISISDASGLNAKALTVSMNPIQDLHGYDNPWVEGAGKNRLKIEIEEQTGITKIIDKDGNILGIKVNGTFTSSTITINATLPVVSGTEYTFNATGLVSGVTLGVRNNIPSAVNITSNSPSANFTPTANNVRIIMNLSDATINTEIYPMIRLSSVTDATFAPYSNICPISGRTEASVTRTGKNLVDIADRTITSQYSSEFFTLPKGTYTVSVFVKNNTTITGGFSIRKSNGSNVVYIGITANMNTRTSASFTLIEDTILRIIISGGSSGYNYDISQAQVELGSTATTYEPYQGETVTVQLGQTVYGGSLDLNSGVLTIDRVKHILSASDTIGLAQQTTNTTRVGFLLPDAKSVIASERMNFLCNNGVYSPDFILNTAPVGSCGLYTAGGNTYFLYHTAKVDNFNTAKANIIASGTEVSYYLATPTTIETSAEEITLLKGNNVLSTDADDIELKYSVSLDSLLPTTTRTLAKSPIVEEPKVETDETEEQR